jgi:hypothetical protein
MDLSQILYYPPRSSSLKFLESSLKATFEILDRYIEYFRIKESPDCPYQYGERATLSLLAGGIWRADPKNLAMWAFITYKGSCEAPIGGRGDLWFVVNGTQCYAEAKESFDKIDLASFNLQKARDLTSLLHAEHCAASAAAEAEAAEWRRQGHKMLPCEIVLGILFVVPYLKKSRWNEREKLLNRYYDVLGKCLAEDDGSYNAVWAKYYRDDPGIPQGDPRDGPPTNLDILVCSSS